MQIHVNTDSNIHGREALVTKVSGTISQALARFSDRVTRIEVHLSDESRGKTGLHDQRCMLEARLQGHQPVAVTDHSDTLEQAVHGAAVKLTHLLDKTLGRLHDHRHIPAPVVPEADSDAA